MDNTIGEKLKELRTEKDVLQKDIAKLLGISTSAYGFYEQGKRIPDSYTLDKLASIFKVSTDFILGRTKERQFNSEDNKTTNSGINAFHIDGEGLNEDELAAVKNMVEMLKAKHKKK